MCRNCRISERAHNVSSGIERRERERPARDSSFAGRSPALSWRTSRHCPGATPRRLPGEGGGSEAGGFRPPEVYGALWRSCFVFVRLLDGLYVCLFALCESRRDGVVVCHWFIHSFGRMNEYAKNGLRKTLSPFEAAHPRSSRNNSLRGPPQYLH